jgi:hypothetical protein
MIPYGVENQVVTLPAPGEILLGVINDPICADGSNHVHIPCTAYAGHIRAERLGDLHSERTHASRCTIDQDLLPGQNPSLIAKTLQGGDCRNRCRSGLLTRTRILGKCPTARAEHRVPWFELGYVPTHRFNLASHIDAELFDLWFAQPEQ